MQRRIFDLCGGKAFRKSAIGLPNGEDVLRHLLQGHDYTVLEIGTYKGMSAAIMSQYCKHVYTIDLVRGQLEKYQTLWDREWLWSELGINNITFIAVEDDFEKKEVVDKLDFDFAFIDGGHEYEQVRIDYRLVKRCGRVLFHDYSDRERLGKTDVYEFINTLENVEQIDVFAYVCES